MMRGGVRDSLLIFVTLLFSFLTLQTQIHAFLFLPIISPRRRKCEFPCQHWRASVVASSTSSPNDDAAEDLVEDNPKKTKYFLSTDQIDQIKSTVDIVSVVESYNLPKFSRKTDQSASVVCPFHDDHSPSMSVDNSRKIFKCFACGEGGDVFKFVRSYSALQGKEMTFYESVRHVVNTWGGPGLELDVMPSSRNLESEEERQARANQRNRILLCNAAAASFYGKALMRLVTAGPARTHLRSRGLSPATVRAFALGYAPDAYFESKVWGEGSLVLHLKSFGFTADEIVQAGLAVETKRKSWKGATGEEGTDTDGFEHLMDRFRGRVIVPVFDETGSNVIAFGGRVLPGRNLTANFKPPKYINSPESILFSKRQELFGLHNAKDAVQKMKDDKLAAGIRHRGTVVIVEGYMDAIALYENGIQNVVASMGTALTIEQLGKAAKVAGSMGGCIVLCLDNDEAGITAVERLCRSQLLAKTCEEHVVEIRVTNLPHHVKDPGEFFESKLGNGDDFEKNVVEPAKDWTTWYTDRLLSRYDDKAIQDAPGSFASICDQISDFLATFSNPADRTKRAYEVAAHLSKIVSGNATQGSSNALQVQLESDLVAMVARKANAKETLQRRVETVDGYGAEKMTAKRMLEGGMSQSVMESSQLAGNATEEKSDWLSAPPKKKKRARVQSRSTDSRGGRARMNRRSPNREALTPHFTGMSISKSTDADWLGVPREKSFKQLRGLAFGIPSTRGEKSEPLVLFNSNDYHGDQYLTAEAFNAGYSKGHIERDSAIREKGVGILIREDQDMQAKLAEERILRAIVQYPDARSAMRAAVSSSDATGTKLDIDFSSEERSWLFNFLIFRGKEIDFGKTKKEDAEGLWEFLSTQDDAPVGSFASNPFGNRMIGKIASPEDEIDANSSPLGTAHNDHLYAVDAQIVLPANLTSPGNEKFSAQTPIDKSEVEKRSDFYHPSTLDDFEVPRDDSVLRDLVSMEDTGLEESAPESEAAIDAKLDYNNIVDGPPEQEGSDGLVGTLDQFFVSDEERFISDPLVDETIQQSFQAELDVQEALAYLLRASAAKKLDDASANWLLASKLLNTRLGKDMGEGGDVTIGVEALDSMNIGDLKQYCESLLTRLKQLCDTVNQLDESAKRISARLMEISMGDSAEGRISPTKQKQVCSEVEAFVNEIPEDFVPEVGEDLDLLDPMYVLSLFQQPGNPIGESGRNHQSVTMQEEINFEAEETQLRLDMLAIEKTWEGMDQDDYVWSMPTEDDLSGQAMPPIFNGHEMSESDQYGEEEPLEETLARIDRDWGDWDDEAVWKVNERKAVGSLDLVAGPVDEPKPESTTQGDLETEWE